MDPVMLDLVGPLKLRWYGFGYMLGFIFAFLLLKWLAGKKLWVLGADRVADFIAMSAVFGVFVGGRLGYILFYQMMSPTGRDALAQDPLLIFKVWDGGMASHGGILGLVIFTYFYAKKNKVSWTGVGDGLCVVAPIGVGLVRIANFINGELYGRAAQGVSWAVQFPQSLIEDLEDKPEEMEQALAEMNIIDPEIERNIGLAITKARDNAELSAVFEKYVEPRHPSQLYEAALEGLVLFVILVAVRLKFPRLANGILTGLFFVFYAGFRIVVENFRQPDIGQALVLGMTKGQFYSTFMILGGSAFIIYALQKNRGKNEDVKPASE